MDLNNKLNIKIDHREHGSQIDSILINKYNFVVEKMMLPTGDYIINDTIVVERKTVCDFIQSIIDGRLFKQAQRMRQIFDIALFIVEGEGLDNCGINIHPNAVKGAMVSIALQWRMPILFARNIAETALLLWLVTTQHNKIQSEISCRYGYRPKTYHKRQLYILQGLPQVGPKLADKLLNYFGSVEKVFTATKEELMEVNNVGKKKAEKIRMLVREERSKYESKEN